MVLLLLPRRSPRHPLPVAHCCCCYDCPSHFSKRTPCFFQLFSTNCCRVGPWQSFRSRSPHRTPCSRWYVSIDRFPTYNRCTLSKTLANNQTTRKFNNTHIKIQQHKHTKGRTDPFQDCSFERYGQPYFWPFLPSISCFVLSMFR